MRQHGGEALVLDVSCLAAQQSFLGEGNKGDGLYHCPSLLPAENVKSRRQGGGALLSLPELNRPS